MAYRRRRTTRRSYGRMPMRRRRAAPTRYGRVRPRSYSRAGRGRMRGRARPARQEIRLVIQQPSDMLPIRPVAGQMARIRRRARF